jgi:aminoglycoside 3-N-acetyltransferase
MITKNQIIRDLVGLGLKENDTVFFTIDIAKVGFFQKNKKETLKEWKNIIETVVGQNGNYVLASYNNCFPWYSKNKNQIFHKKIKSSSGSLPNFFINCDDTIRSSHPSNSMIGKGDGLKDIFERHSALSTSYSIVKDLVYELDCKFVQIGTIDKKNAPQSMHVSQEILKHTSNIFTQGFNQIYYYEEEKLKLFRRKDVGGCSEGGYKLYSEFFVNNILKVHNVGNALSCCMNGKESIKLTLELLQCNPLLTSCDNYSCIHCYGNPSKSLKFLPFFFLNKFLIGTILRGYNYAILKFKHKL